MLMVVVLRVFTPVLIACPNQDKSARDLNIHMGRCDDMTPKQCKSLCTGYAFFGLQLGNECRCGDTSWKPKYQKKVRLTCTESLYGQ